MTKTSTLEGGLEWTSVQVIAPHDQCLRWVQLRHFELGITLTASPQ